MQETIDKKALKNFVFRENPAKVFDQKLY